MPRIFMITALLASLPFTAHATCADDVDTLANRYGITASLPRAGASSANTSDKLGASGGVIAPPPTGDTANVAPTIPSPDTMQTAPAIAPQTATGATEGSNTSPQSKTSSVDMAAAANSQAASLLEAARHAGKSGDEATCQQRLADARGLLEKKPSISQ